MKRRILSALLALTLCLSLLPTAAFAAEESGTETAPAVVTIYDGKITKGALWTALKCSSTNIAAYHYRQIDKVTGEPLTGWKRLNTDSDQNSSAMAELIEDQALYELQSITKANDLLDDFLNLGKWDAAGTFRIQNCHKITIDSSALTTGTVTVGGKALESSYDVKAGESLTLTFSTVSGSVPQVKLGSGLWCTVANGSYTITPNAGNTLAVRYAAAETGKHTLTINVNNDALGCYSVTGADSDHVAAETPVTLTVTPYNSSTTTDNDQWAYVKSVRVNGSELTDTDAGSYSGTVFTGTFTVNADTSVEIEFAPRLVLKSPAYKAQKYEQDPETLLYTAKMNMDKKVSEQDTAIAQSILDNTVDKDQSSAYSDAKVLVKAVVDAYSDDPLYYDISEDVTLTKTILFVPTTVFKGHWGDKTFHNGNEVWEEIQLELPATADGRYPAVRTEDLTVWVLEVRPALKIEGTVAEITVESEANLSAAIEAAVLAKILNDNEGATLDTIGAGNITYSYNAAFGDLKPNDATNIAVNVSVSKSDNYLASSGTITVPARKASSDSKVTVTVVPSGSGTAAYTVSGKQYTFTLTPSSGYYVEKLVIADTPKGGNGNSETKTLTDMTAYKDGKYSYRYTLTAEDNHSYALTAHFVEYKLTAAPASEKFPYYDGQYADNAAVAAAVKEKVPEPVCADFPNGTLYLEYNAGSSTWLTIGAALPDDENNSYHAFGKNAMETIRYRYVFTADGFTVTSNTVTLTLTDEREETEIKAKTVKPISYADYSKAEDKTKFLLDALLDGVYVKGGSKIENAPVTISPAADNLEAGSDQVITLQYAGNETYKSSSQTVSLTLTGTAATVKVTASPTTVVYGKPYTVTVETVPENLETIRFAIGLDLTKIKLEQKLVPLSVTILGPDKLRQALQECTDDSGKLTATSLLEGLYALLADEVSYEKTGVSRAALTQLYWTLTYSAAYSETTPVIIANEWPTNVGFYVVGAIAADPSVTTSAEYAFAPTAVDYLSITPQHINTTLGWANELENNSVKKTDLTAEHMAAKVASVAAGGSKEDAAKQLTHIYLGLNEENTLALYTESELKSGAVYTQVAFLMNSDMNVNQMYSAAPIQREFAVDAAYADVQFVDSVENKKPVDVYFYEIPAGETSAKVSAPVTVDGEIVSAGLTLSYQSLYMTTNSAGAENPDLPGGSGFYLIHASYKATDANSAITVGKDSALLVISGAIAGFKPEDTTVTYDGTERFLQITDTNTKKIPYLSVIADTASKTVNILLPNGMTLEDLLGSSDALESLSGFGEILQYFQVYSSANVQAKALSTLLTQVAADIQDLTGWTVTINGAKPKNVGIYPVYLMTITDGGLYLGKRTLRIEPKPITAVITVNKKTYDGSTAATISSVAFNDGDLCGDDKITITGLTAAFADANAGETKTVNIDRTNVSITGNELGNYAVTIPAETTGKISPAPVTVATAPTAKVGLIYSGTAQALITAGTAGSNGTMQYKVGESGTWGDSIPTGTNAGSYTVYYKAAGSGNYCDSAEGSFTASISPAKLTVTAKPCTITYGTAPANDGVEYSGFVNNETEAKLTGTLAFDYNYQQFGGVGSYTITPKGLNSTNYTIEFKSGVLTVEQKEVGINWTNTSLTFNGNRQAPTATATGLVNSDSCTVTVTGAATDVGSYTATAATLGNGNYKLPANAATAFSITQAAAPTLTGVSVDLVYTLTTGTADLTKITGIPANAGTVRYTVGTLPDGVTDAEISGTTLRFTLNGEGVKDTSYTIPVTVSSTNYADATTNVTVTLTAKINQRLDVAITGWTYGEYDAAVNAPRFSKPDGVSAQVLYTWQSPTQSGGGTPSATVPTDAGNYRVTVHYETLTEICDGAAEFTIAPATLTIRAEDKSVYRGSALPALSYTVSGLVGGDTLTTQPILTCEAADTNTVGTYAITVSGADAGSNYAVVYQAGTLTVSNRPVVSKPLHNVNVAESVNGDAAANQDEAREGTIITVTVDPAGGYTLGGLTVTDKDGNTVKVTHVGGNKYSFIMPDSDVTVRASFSGGTDTSFVDVPANKYFYDAVNWAVANGITSGVDATHFAPYASCTRGQLVTFLWRTVGKPAAKSTENPFSDVRNGAFYQAILWAAENGIVTGYSDGTFRPNAPVTRQQVAAILWRYAKFAKMDVSVGEDTNILSFHDAASISEYAIPAIQWAVGDGVMQGNGGYLLPHATCTRAQIVTMLYRLLGK